MNSIPPEAQRGRLFVLIAFALTIVGELFSTITDVSRGGLGFYLFAGTVRLLIASALFYALFRGYRWVRWLMVSWVAFVLLLCLPTLIRTFHSLAIAVVLQLGITLALLAFPASVSAFINYQRAKYRKN